MLKSFYLFLLASSFSMATFAQSSGELKKKQADIQREIDALKKSLDETKKYKKESLGQLAMIQKKLRLRQQQINNINEQVNVIQGNINQSWREIVKLRGELDTLKIQYQKSIVYAYKNRSNYDFINFIFSAGSFNDALKRVAYLKSYRAYREQQAANIHNTQNLLQQKIAGLNENKEEKSKALKEQNKQKEILVEDKKEQDHVVGKLKSREKEIVKDMNAKRKQDASLRAAISAAIRREIEAEKKRLAAIKAEEDRKAAAAKKEAAAKAGTGSTAKTTTPATTTPPAAEPAKKESKPLSPLENRPEAKALSDNFEKSRGSLPWPMSSGNIAMHFGPQVYFGKVTYDNPGITIEGEGGASVKAVFDGEVSAVTSIGEAELVILRHGKYFTTYSNLSSTSVSKGQQIKAGQIIGKLATKEEGRGELEFLITNDRNNNLDPEKWLR